MLGYVISAIALVIVLIVLFGRKKRAQTAPDDALVRQLNERIEAQTKQTEIARAELQELRAIVAKITPRLDEQQQQLLALSQQQQSIEQQNPQTKLYAGAVKLIELGASLEEVMRQCELPRAEAELLFSLHKKS